MNAQVVCFAGRIASGKSSISSAFAATMQWRHVGFGNYVRSVAERRGLDPHDRAALQSTGENLILERGWSGFCQDVLLHHGVTAHEPLVIDGIRHVEALDTLRGLVMPRRTTLVYLDVEEAVLQERRERRGDAPKDTHSFEAHSTETQVRVQLPAHADILLNANDPIEDLILELRKQLTDLPNDDAVSLDHRL